jgi:hypothetical protein
VTFRSLWQQWNARIHRMMPIGLDATSNLVKMLVKHDRKSSHSVFSPHPFHRFDIFDKSIQYPWDIKRPYQPTKRFHPHHDPGEKDWTDLRWFPGSGASHITCSSALMKVRVHVVCHTVINWEKTDASLFHITYHKVYSVPQNHDSAICADRPNCRCLLSTEIREFHWLTRKIQSQLIHCWFEYILLNYQLMSLIFFLSQLKDYFSLQRNLRCIVNLMALLSIEWLLGPGATLASAIRLPNNHILIDSISASVIVVIQSFHPRNWLFIWSGVTHI